MLKNFKKFMLETDREVGEIHEKAEEAKTVAMEAKAATITLQKQINTLDARTIAMTNEQHKEDAEKCGK